MRISKAASSMDLANTMNMKLEGAVQLANLWAILKYPKTITSLK